MDMEVKRTEIWLVELNPTVGSEVKKSRPCIIISPDEANKYLNTVTIAPLTSTIKLYPTRVKCSFEGKEGQIAIDQVRTVDKLRLKKKLGTLDKRTVEKVFQTLQDYFSF
ncbi:MAG: type II toxin-antitoxin system PemK/MazF family toxin [Sediminibacterium sp.]|nr:type II toxin-antitoxin system PemK/MazF family toxin [Sediminibacterium sp.]TXT32936.1 MAG: mRNA interferase [Chitinophagaceae bacterium]